jgi:hypothetical protein
MGGALAYQISPLVVPYVTPSTQVVPTILVPDLTGLITRCSPDPICGGTYGNIYRCIYHGPDGDVEVRADFTFLPHSVMYPSQVAVKAIRPQFINDQVMFSNT